MSTVAWSGCRLQWRTRTKHASAVLLTVISRHFFFLTSQQLCQAVRRSHWTNGQCQQTPRCSMRDARVAREASNGVEQVAEGAAVPFEMLGPSHVLRRKPCGGPVLVMRMFRIGWGWSCRLHVG